MTELALYNNQISDISDLGGLTNLRNLWLNGNQISDASAVAHVEDADITDQTITEIIPNGENEIELPPIFAQIKNRITESIEYKLKNCTLSEDGTKIIINNDANTAEVELIHKISETSYNPYATMKLEREIEKIEITGIPNYQIEGKDINISNAKFKITYKNGETREIDIQENMITGYDSSKVGEQEITITYEGKTATAKIEVVKDEEITMHFLDENLYAAIKEKLGDKVKSSNDDTNEIVALKSDIYDTTSLSLGSKGIKDITGIENFKSLTDLYLYQNQISDISAIEGLKNLTELALYNNQISDISDLSGLTNLTDLYLGGNQISDISAIEGLKN